MARYFLELAYRGTAFSGFQIQENAATIQLAVTRAMETYIRVPFLLTGSSRTDAGVHAEQNFFHFDTDLVIHNKIVYNLNALLPADIAVKGIYPVPDQAHCRFDALSREYAYTIYPVKNPFLSDRAWLYPYPLSVPLLQEGASIIREYRDFTSFSKRNTQVKSFLCQIERSEWVEKDDCLIYQVKANRFLRGMVRGLVGTLLKLGRGQISPDQFRSIIEARDCTLADFSTPPQGLVLKRVHFPEMLDRFLRKEV
jgi:tRNA pseudouridine38-40 synthase